MEPFHTRVTRIGYMMDPDAFQEEITKWDDRTGALMDQILKGIQRRTEPDKMPWPIGNAPREPKKETWDDIKREGDAMAERIDQVFKEAREMKNGKQG